MGGRLVVFDHVEEGRGSLGAETTGFTLRLARTRGPGGVGAKHLGAGEGPDAARPLWVPGTDLPLLLQSVCFL